MATTCLDKILCENAWDCNITITDIDGNTIDPLKLKNGDTVVFVLGEKPGCTFIGWVDENGNTISYENYGENKYKIQNIDCSKQYLAQYRQNDYVVNLVSNNGNCFDNMTTHAHYGQIIQVSAPETTNCHFLNWTIGDVVVSDELSFSFYVTESTTIRANYDNVYYRITAKPNNVNRGSCSGSGVYLLNTTATITANPNTGYVFSSWDDNNSTNPRTITVRGNRTYIARFEKVNNSVTVTTTTGGTVLGTGDYPTGTSVTLQAVAEPGYRFDYWEMGGEQYRDTSLSFIVSGDRNVTPHFVRETFFITATASPSTYGYFDPAPLYSYIYGDTAVIEAKPNSGYRFVGWNDGFTSARREIEVTSNVDLTAFFSALEPEHTLTIEMPDNTFNCSIYSGYRDVSTKINNVVTADGIQGTVFELSPVAPSGKRITNIMDGDVIIWDETSRNRITYTMGNSDVTLTMNAEAINYNIRATVLPSNMIKEGISSSSGPLITEEKFRYRKTNGISGTTLITEVFGNSIAWNQLIAIPASDKSKTDNGVTITDNRDGSYTVSTNENGATADTNISMNTFLIGGHTYCMIGCPSGGSVNSYLLYFTTTYVSSGMSTDTGSGCIFVANSGTNLSYPRIIVKSGAVITDPVVFKPQLFDLTIIFGASNEPTTVAQFKAWLSENVGLRNYYPYDSGSILNFSMTGVKTICFNQWNEEWEPRKSYDISTGEKINALAGTWCCKDKIPVIGGETYYCYSSNTSYLYSRMIFLDQNDTPISSKSPFLNGSVSIPETCMNVVFHVSNGTSTPLTYEYDLNFNISNTAKNGTYEPYNGHTYPFDTTKIYGKLNGEGNYVQVFPNGMRKTGSVQDVLTASEAVVKMGAADLGSLTWINSGYNNIFYSSELEGFGTYHVGTPNIITAYYNTVAIVTQVSIQNLEDMCITSRNTYNRLYLKNSNYENAPTSQNNWLSGVYINYELATPLTYTNLVYRDNGTDTPFTEDYLMAMEVDEYGTECILPYDEEVRCPIVCDMKYGADIVKLELTVGGVTEVFTPTRQNPVQLYTNVLYGTEVSMKVLPIVSPYNFSYWRTDNGSYTTQLITFNVDKDNECDAVFTRAEQEQNNA